MAESETASRLLDHLPAAYGQDPLLGRFLLAFERILRDIPRPEYDASGQASLDATLGQIDRFMRPRPPVAGAATAPEPFLPWLASWVGISLMEDWPEDARRQLVAEAVWIHRRRGTREALLRFLEIVLGTGNVRVEDQVAPAGETPKPGYVAHNLAPGGLPAHYFYVVIDVGSSDPQAVSRASRWARSVIEREKPAHTVYGLHLKFPGMRIVNDPVAPDRGLLVGRTTMIGSEG